MHDDVSRLVGIEGMAVPISSDCVIESATFEESYDVPLQTQPQFARAAR